MLSYYARLMAGMEREFEQALVEAVCVRPWMGAYVGLLRQGFAVWGVGLAGEVVDRGLMVGAFLELSYGAEAAGDELGMWAFDQFYRWASALVRGEEYIIPGLPGTLARLVVGGK